MVDSLFASNPYGTSSTADAEVKNKLFNFQSIVTPQPLPPKFSPAPISQPPPTFGPITKSTQSSVLNMGNNQPRYSDIVKPPSIITQSLPVPTPNMFLAPKTQPIGQYSSVPQQSSSNIQSNNFTQIIRDEQGKISGYQDTQIKRIPPPTELLIQPLKDIRKIIPFDKEISDLSKSFGKGLSIGGSIDRGDTSIYKVDNTTKLDRFNIKQKNLNQGTISQKIEKLGGETGLFLGNIEGDTSQFLTGDRRLLRKSTVDVASTELQPAWLGVKGGWAGLKLGGTAYYDLESKGISKLASLLEKSSPQTTKILNWVNEVPKGQFAAMGKDFIFKTIPRTYILGKAGLELNNALIPKKYVNDPVWNSIRREAESNVNERRSHPIKDPLLFGKGIAETIPLTNIVTNKLLGTDEEVRTEINRLIKDRGLQDKYDTPSVNAMINYRVRSRPFELPAVFGAGVVSEGTAKNIVGKVGDKFKILGEMPIKDVVSKFSTRAALKTGFIGAGESAVLNFYNQLSNIGPEGVEGVKLDFKSTYGTKKELSNEETQNLFKNINKNALGTKLNLTDSNNSTIPVTKYRIDKEGQIYDIYVDKDNKPIKGEQKEDLSRKFDIPQLGISLGTGFLTTAATNKLLLSQQAKDAATLIGGELKGGINKYVTKSGKYSIWDLIPHPTKTPNLPGKLKVSTSSSSSSDVGLTPSKVRQGLFYTFDPTEYGSDKLQDLFRRWGGMLGKTYTEAEIGYVGKSIPFRPKVTTMSQVFNFGQKTNSNNNAFSGGKSNTLETPINIQNQLQSQTNVDSNVPINTNPLTFINTNNKPVSTTNNIDTFINSETSTSTNTSTLTNTNTNTSVTAMANTFQYMPPMFPGMGMLGGFETKGNLGGSGSVTTGKNINKLKNFFFDKTNYDRPITRNTLLSGKQKSLSVNDVNIRGNLGRELGYNKLIVTNSTPFNKKSMKRMIKRKK